MAELGFELYFFKETERFPNRFLNQPLLMPLSIYHRSRCPQTFSLDNTSLGQHVLWIMRPVDNTSLIDVSRPWTAYRWWIIITTVTRRKRGIFSFYLRYLTQLRPPPLRFFCVGDAGIEPRTDAPLALTDRCSAHSARSHLQSVRSHPYSPRFHPLSARSHILG